MRLVQFNEEEYQNLLIILEEKTTLIKNSSECVGVSTLIVKLSNTPEIEESKEKLGDNKPNAKKDDKTN